MQTQNYSLAVTHDDNGAAFAFSLSDESGDIIIHAGRTESTRRACWQINHAGPRVTRMQAFRIVMDAAGIRGDY